MKLPGHAMGTELARSWSGRTLTSTRKLRSRPHSAGAGQCA